MLAGEVAPANGPRVVSNASASLPPRAVCRWPPNRFAPMAHQGCLPRGSSHDPSRRSDCSYGDLSGPATRYAMKSIKDGNMRDRNMRGMHTLLSHMLYLRFQISDLRFQISDFRSYILFSSLILLSSGFRVFLRCRVHMSTFFFSQADESVNTGDDQNCRYETVPFRVNSQMSTAQPLRCRPAGASISRGYDQGPNWRLKARPAPPEWRDVGGRHAHSGQVWPRGSPTASGQARLWAFRPADRRRSPSPSRSASASTATATATAALGYG